MMYFFLLFLWRYNWCRRCSMYQGFAANPVKRLKMMIFRSFLITFEVRNIFWEVSVIWNNLLEPTSKVKQKNISIYHLLVLISLFCVTLVNWFCLKIIFVTKGIEVFRFRFLWLYSQDTKKVKKSPLLIFSLKKTVLFQYWDSIIYFLFFFVKAYNNFRSLFPYYSPPSLLYALSLFYLFSVQYFRDCFSIFFSIPTFKVDNAIYIQLFSFGVKKRPKRILFCVPKQIMESQN